MWTKRRFVFLLRRRPIRWLRVIPYPILFRRHCRVGDLILPEDRFPLFSLIYLGEKNG